MGDYKIAPAPNKSAETMDQLLLVIQAKRHQPLLKFLLRLDVSYDGWQPGSIHPYSLSWQSHASSASLLLTRMVFVEEFRARVGPSGDYTDSESLGRILRWFNWFQSDMSSVSPALQGRRQRRQMHWRDCQTASVREKRCYFLKKSLQLRKQSSTY